MSRGQSGLTGDSRSVIGVAADGLAQRRAGFTGLGGGVTLADRLSKISAAGGPRAVIRAACPWIWSKDRPVLRRLGTSLDTGIAGSGATLTHRPGTAGTRTSARAVTPADLSAGGTGTLALAGTLTLPLSGALALPLTGALALALTLPLSGTLALPLALTLAGARLRTRP